ncbi:hypothetical protein BJX66DRAFT_320345, partial [Aspergillus keveii]
MEILPPKLLSALPPELLTAVCLDLDLDSYICFSLTCRYLYKFLHSMAGAFLRVGAPRSVISPRLRKEQALPSSSDTSPAEARPIHPYKVITLRSRTGQMIKTRNPTMTIIHDVEPESPFHYNNGIIAYIRRGWLCTLDIYTSLVEKRTVQIEDLEKSLDRKLDKISVLHYSCGIVTIWTAIPNSSTKPIDEDGSSLLVSIKLEESEWKVLNIIRTSGSSQYHFIRNTNDTIFHGRDDSGVCLLTRYTVGGDSKPLSNFIFGSAPTSSWRVIAGDCLYLFAWENRARKCRCRKIHERSGEEVDWIESIPVEIAFMSACLIRGSVWLTMAGLTEKHWSWTYHTREISSSDPAPWRKVLESDGAEASFPGAVPSPAFEMLFGVTFGYFWIFTCSGVCHWDFPNKGRYMGNRQHDEASVAYTSNQGEISVISFDPRVKCSILEAEQNLENTPGIYASQMKDWERKEQESEEEYM